MFHTPTPFPRRTPRLFPTICTPATINPFQSPSVASPSPPRPTVSRHDSWASEDQAVVVRAPRPAQGRNLKFWIAVVILETGFFSWVAATMVLFLELKGEGGDGVQVSTAVWGLVSVVVCFVGLLVCCVGHGRVRAKEGPKWDEAQSIALRSLERSRLERMEIVERGRSSADENRRRSGAMQKQLDLLEDELQRRNHQSAGTTSGGRDEGDLGIYPLSGLAPASGRPYPVSTRSNDSATVVRSSFNSSIGGHAATTNYSPLDDMLSPEQIRNLSPRESRAYFEMRRERHALQRGVHVAGQGTLRAEPSARRVVNPSRFELRDDFEVDDEQTDGHVEMTDARVGEVHRSSRM